MRSRIKATHFVLGLVCVMYFITYVDRVNISTAASEIQSELRLSNTELGLAFSAFAYPYLIFQIAGGWVGDRFGRVNFCSVRRDMGSRDHPHRLRLRPLQPIHRAIPARLRRRRDFSDRYAGDAGLDAGWAPGLRSRNRSFVRASGQRRHTSAHCCPYGCRDMARIVHDPRSCQLRLGNRLGVLFPQ